MHSSPSNQAALAGALRGIVNVGSRVRVLTSDDCLTGTFTERTQYKDGTPAAWVDLDMGPLVVCPIADLRPL